jgi:hypothetical protein
MHIYAGSMPQNMHSHKICRIEIQNMQLGCAAFFWGFFWKGLGVSQARVPTHFGVQEFQ